MPNEKTESQNTCDVVIYGHNHFQSLSKLFHKTLINSGSVGNSLNLIGDAEHDGNVNETAKANYLIVYGNYGKKEYDDALSFEFVSLRYDIEKELKMNKDNYNIVGYEEELKLGKYRNQAKLTEIINEKFSKK